MPSKSARAEYARMWPREIFDVKEGKGSLAATLDFLKEPGVYILYRDEHPYYIGQAESLFGRLRLHAVNVKTRYYNFWTHFSAFAEADPKRRDQLEAILIAAMPTANSSKPRLAKDMPRRVAGLLKKMRELRVKNL